MATTTIDRINQLSAEKARLYRDASNGHRGDREVLARVHALDAEIGRLWEIRRQEKAVRRDDIDRLVDRGYEEVYGRDAASRELSWRELAELAEVAA